MSPDRLILQDRLQSPTLAQPLQTNKTLIKEQQEEIIRSILIESINKEPENHRD
jgi:hypothetical protein